MPNLGEVRTYQNETRRWDGQAWRLVDTPAPEAPQNDSGPSQPWKATLGLVGGVPALTRIAESVATSPTLPRTMGSMANGLTTIGELGHGIYSGNMNQVLGAPIAGWAAGKGGYWLGKGLQRVASPVARVGAAIGPAAQVLGGASGVDDLAQMPEPNRKDIGFLGIGPSQPSDPNHPAVVNAILSALAQKLGIGGGTSQSPPPQP